MPSERPEKARAPRNRTMSLTQAERPQYRKRLIRLSHCVTAKEILGNTIHQDIFEALPFLPEGFVDLLLIDPPYNLDKSFNGRPFKRMEGDQYEAWIESWIDPLIKTLKKTASVYICADWRSSGHVQRIIERRLTVQSRITWEREKGRGALRNWKNCLEDIWFCTVSNQFTFNLDAVKVKRKVIAPYTLADGTPKDWQRGTDGDYRMTHPSNLWADLTVPFWSMPENTDHPTQKPEKMLAKIILASSNPGDVVFDPFLGSGTTSVTARKLGRQYVGIERDETYCLLAEKRLENAKTDATIQGYESGVFWERNSMPSQATRMKPDKRRQSKRKENTDGSGPLQFFN